MEPRQNFPCVLRYTDSWISGIPLLCLEEKFGKGRTRCIVCLTLTAINNTLSKKYSYVDTVWNIAFRVHTWLISVHVNI